MKNLRFLLLMGIAVSVVFCSCETLARKRIKGDAFYVMAEGNDHNNGLSEEKPFRSLFKAMVMAASSPVKNIIIIGTLNVKSEQSSNAERVFLIQGMGDEEIVIRGKRRENEPAVLSAAESGRRVVLVRGTVPIRFEDIEISGGNSSHEGGGMIVGPGSRVIMGPGSIIRDNSSTSIGGGIFVAAGSLLIDGGAIFNNQSGAMGGGIAVSSGELIIQNGEIYNNNAQGGGGVGIFMESRFTLTGGRIHNNTASIAGGGVLLNQGGTFAMENGLIEENLASGSGGGIALMDRSSFTLSNGEIRQNRAAGHGGGIAGDHTGIVNIKGGFIGANRAGENGGGIFTTGVFVKSAGKIYGNDMPEDAANVAAVGAAVYIFRNDGIHRIREISAGEDLALDAAKDDGWTNLVPSETKTEE